MAISISYCNRSCNLVTHKLANTIIKNLLRGVLKIFSEVDNTFNRNRDSYFLLTETVKNNHSSNLLTASKKYLHF